MKTTWLLPIVLTLNISNIFANTSWENPAVLCPEEILVKGLKCLDFSKVENVYTDFPDETTVEEIKDWKNNKASDLKLCRNKEILRRENLKAGTYSPATIEQAWMVTNGGKQVSEKLEAIQAATLKYEIPPQVLIGAMTQESLMASLGVSADGGNYSCGLAQLNIQEWCQSMNSLPTSEQAKYGWPSEISCEPDMLPTTIVKPFHDIALKNLGSRPTYQLDVNDFQGITPDQVESSFPSADSSVQAKRFLAVNSFVNNCQNISLSINFKAQTLRRLYDYFVPSSLKSNELYTDGHTFNRTCQNKYSSKFYPLHTGWLLAVAMYNAGPLQAKLVGHYYQSKSDKLPSMNPLDLIEALHWGGKYKPGTDNIVFKNMDIEERKNKAWKKFLGIENNNMISQSWFKSCIVQRHVARVIQHVTVPSISIAKSLEQGGCKASGVPDYRQASSGVKGN